MTDTRAGGIDRIREFAARTPGTERLAEEAQRYVEARLRHSVTGLGDRLSEATARLTSGGDGAGLDGLSSLVKGISPARAAMGALGLGKGGGKGLMGVVGAMVGGKQSKGGGGGKKPTMIIEDIDVGVPLREAYNQWTVYQEYSTWSKGVTGVDPTDEVKSNWKLKVFKSNRSYQATVLEQIPDQRIAWTSEGGKGITKGVVTFHPLGERLTRIVLVMEYHPKGFFEHTGNIWRAQGRRARLDLKLFKHFITTQNEASDEAWRGEIRDGEVVRSHEDAVREEEGEQGDHDEDREQDGDHEEDRDRDEDRDREDEYDDEDYEDEDEYDDEDYEEEPRQGERDRSRDEARSR